MARYIKANPKVAAYLHLENDRLKLKDGNYILWQGDMTAFAPLPMLNETLTMIGAIALMPHEAKQEQDGTVVRPLPTATDERFVMEETNADTAPSTDGEAESVTDENVEEQVSEAASAEEQTDKGNTNDEPTDEGNITDEPTDEVESATVENVEEQPTEAASTEEQTDKGNANDEPTGEGNATEEPSDADVKSETTETDNTENE